jgi:hypothetical protein
MGYLIDFLIGAAGRIIAGELGAHAEPVARWVIEKAAERLPRPKRNRFLEEWLAHLNDTPGTLRKLSHAAGCYIGATTLAPVLRAEIEKDVVAKVDFISRLTDVLLHALLTVVHEKPDEALDAAQRDLFITIKRQGVAHIGQQLASISHTLEELHKHASDPRLVRVRKGLERLVPILAKLEEAATLCGDLSAEETPAAASTVPLKSRAKDGSCPRPEGTQRPRSQKRRST